VQAITIPEHRWAEYVGSADFINTVIFPGGCLVNATQLSLAAAKAGSRLTLCSLDEFGLHYAETLRRWRANFNAALPKVSARRVWCVCVCVCGGGGGWLVHSTTSTTTVTRLCFLAARCRSFARSVLMTPSFARGTTTSATVKLDLRARLLACKY
jgi:hypothetical protein